MFLLDMRTILFGYVLTNIVCLLVIALLWRQNRKRFAGLSLWVFDFALQGAALLLIVLRGIIPDSISIVVAHAFVMTGALLGYMALSRFVGQKTVQIHNYVLVALAIPVQAYFAFVRPDLAIRNLNLSIGLLVICLQCSWLMLYQVGAAKRPLTRWVGIVFGIYCVVSGIRIVEFFTGGTGRTDLFQAGMFDALIILVYQILLVLLTYALVLMVNKRLQMDITLQEEKYSKAFYSSPYAIFLTRLSDGNIIEVNDGFLRITGYGESEVRGKTTRSLGFWPKDDDRSAFIGDLRLTGSVREREMQFRTKSGRMITGLLSGELLSIENEICALSNFNDITDRKIMEHDLRKSETMIRTVIDNLPIGVAVNSIDPEVNFNYMNENFTRFYRTTPEALSAPDSFWDAVYEDPQTREEMKRRILADCASGDPRRMSWTDIPISRQGEETSYVSARNIPVPGESLMISAVWDITELKKNQEEIRSLNQVLEQKVDLRTRELHDSQMALLNIVDDLNETASSLVSANQALEAVNRELAAFSYSVSHDLRAPLRSIDGFSSALVEDYGDNLNEEGRNYLERIRRATQTMGRLIDDLLNLSRVTQSEVQIDEVDLSLLVSEIAEFNRARNPSVKVDMRIQQDMIVRADQRLMNILLMNLLDNAWKFTSKCRQPQIAFGTEIRNGEKVFYLRDNGAGFDMKYAGKLFGAFQRLHRADEFPGTGVGLATVQRIIQRHGGRIWAEGEVGRGAAFFFTLSEE